MIKPFIKIFTLGTTYIQNIFKDPVFVEEKLDGSQFVVGKDPDGNLYMRSKGAQLYVENPQQMFKEAINYIYDVQHRIPNDTVFYCEYMQRPKHNVLKYDRVPKNNLMLFAISDYMGTKFYFDRGHIEEWSIILDIDPVPTFYEGMVNNINELMSFMERDSFLGGTKIEGFVVKNYHNQFLLGGQPIPLMAGKFVSEIFKEKAKISWSKDHTTGGKWESFIESYRTEARWQKAIQHLAEADKLLYEPKDIGNLIKEIQRDIVDEEKEEIKEFLWKYFGNDLVRRSSSGVAEYYKGWLAKRSFEQ